jgi:hypothetical protein
MIAAKYKPTVQKDLFHKDVVNHIKKWIKIIEKDGKNNLDVKRVLFIHGPIGSSKTVTVECLFKSYNLIDVDVNSLSPELLQCIVGFNEMTLSNVDKWNLKTNKEKSNIVLVDNLELCDKNIEIFIDLIHNKHNINVPVILISNNTKYKDVFANNNNCTFVEFKKPSLLELTKFVIEINKPEGLNLTRENIRLLVNKSEFDIRQLLFLIDQWILTQKTRFTFSDFMNSISVKNRDMDLSEKMYILFNKDNQYNFRDYFVLASSDPQGLSNSIYQNYITNSTFTEDFDKRQGTSVANNTSPSSSENLNLLQNYSNIMDSISYSNIVQNEIYENQHWTLYDDYICNSTVMPSYYIKEISQIGKANEYELMLTPFKDISYNFINSYEEVKRITTCNLYSKSLQTHDNKQNLAIFNSSSCFLIVQVFINCITKLNRYFDKNKRGKNTTKQEKLDLCNNMNKDDIKWLDILVGSIYYYKLFTINEQDFILNIDKYKNDNYIQKVDLSIFKRFLNIFTMDDSHKIFKSNVEMSIQYKLLQVLIVDNTKEKVVKQKTENMVMELSDIWNI